MAAVIVEPVAGNMGWWPRPGAKGLRRLCTRYGCLRFDEVISLPRLREAQAAHGSGLT